MSTDTDPATLLSGATAARWVGQRMPRLEDQRMVTGHGQYIDDLNKPGMVHVAFVRSAVARGRITGLDVDAGPPGAGRDRGADRGRDQPRAQLTSQGAVTSTPRRVLADGDVRFVGE